MKSKLFDSSRGFYLYGTTPPRAGSSVDKVQTIAEKLTHRLSQLELDAINVYDIQDEAGRTDVTRPFPFLPTIDSRQYSKYLKDLTGTEIINYKCVVHQPLETFNSWLSEAWEQFNLNHLALVGGSNTNLLYRGPTLAEAAQLTAAHPYNFTFGGVTIAERHARKGNEHLRLIEKSQQGMQFFTSQVVYQPDSTIQLLRDYYRECRRLQVPPVRIILTFAPCGQAKTLQFLKWLGVSVPTDIEETIFTAANPVERSVEVCCANLKAILESVDPTDVFLGINVESVSIKKDEIEASIALFDALKGILDSFYRDKVAATAAIAHSV